MLLELELESSVYFPGFSEVEAWPYLYLYLYLYLVELAELVADSSVLVELVADSSDRSVSSLV